MARLVNSFCRARARNRSGFTLLEAALATVIVGVAFVAVLQLLAAGTVANVDSSGLTTGVNLARNIRELTLQSPYANLSAYNGVSYSPPHDSQGATISELTGWQQVISVQAVDPNRLTVNQNASPPPALRITVTINRNGSKICDLSWYCFVATP